MHFSAPLKAEIALTSRCNLRCCYCHVFDSPNETEEELSTAEWIRVFEELDAMKVLDVILSGGEPLIRDDIFELWEALGRTHLGFSLLTNGTLLDQRHADALKKNSRLRRIQVSLDGLKEVHEKSCGEGSFESALNAVRILVRARLTFQVRVTVTKYNYQTLDETVGFLVEQEKVPRVFLGPAAVFVDKKIVVPWDLTDRERLEMIVTMLRLHERYPKHVDISLTAASYASKNWPRMIDALRRNAPPNNKANFFSCTAQSEKLAIRANGDVAPCTHLARYVLGRAGRDSLKEMWENSPVLQEMRENPFHAPVTRPGCEGCEYHLYCRPMAACVNDSEYASSLCLKHYREIAPDFDFEKMAWKSDVSS